MVGGKPCVHPQVCIKAQWSMFWSILPGKVTTVVVFDFCLSLWILNCGSNTNARCIRNAPWEHHVRALQCQGSCCGPAGCAASLEAAAGGHCCISTPLIMALTTCVLGTAQFSIPWGEGKGGRWLLRLVQIPWLEGGGKMQWTVN